jgi:hypothetical protein
VASRNGPTERIMDDQLYRDIVSGRRCGAAAAVVRGGLRAASVPYSVAVRLRNRAYDLGLKRTYRVEVPVVSVGNLTLGGTGKTPLVEHLARWFRAAGLRVCILSRGYGAADGAANDEAQVLAENLPEVPHLQGRDRVALARRAIDVHHAQVLLLDDGFQHRRLARDLDLVILDALDPLGGNNLFPRGLLREPLSSLRRADLILLNRADLLSDRQRQRIHDYCAAAAGRDLTGRLPWIEIAQRPCGFTGKRGVTSAQRAAWNTERRIGRGECWNDSVWHSALRTRSVPRSIALPRSAASATRQGSAVRWSSSAGTSGASASFPTITHTRPPTSRRSPHGPPRSTSRRSSPPKRTSSSSTRPPWAAVRCWRWPSKSPCSTARICWRGSLARL